jgi:hypothetical protein
VATYSEIPLRPAMPQAISIALSGVTYNLTFKWFDQAGTWLVDIADTANNPIVVGVPLVTGGNLVEQYGHLGFTGQLWCATDGQPDMQPSFTSLGDTSHLYYVEP